VEQNQKLMERLAKVEAAQADKAFTNEPKFDGQKARDGHKLIKARVLSEDGDLEWAILEVPVADNRKGVDLMQAQHEINVHKSKDLGVGNPMSKESAGPNDITVTGV